MGFDNHSHGPSHAIGPQAASSNRARLAFAFLIVATFFVVEAAAGVITGSLSLISDAGHMFADVLGLGMALAAIQLTTRFEDGSAQDRFIKGRTFGLYRLEILAALVNSALLLGLAVWVFSEAVGRFGSSPEVLGTAMLAVASLGLLSNVAAFLLLRRGSKESLNLEAAYLEVVADTVGSIGVIIAAILIEIWGLFWADQVVALLIAVWIAPRAWKLGSKAIHILMQAAPSHIDLAQLNLVLSDIDGVIGVHDLHVWTLTSQMEAASVHLTVNEEAEPYEVLNRARSLLASDFAIPHGTIQIEPESYRGCQEATW